MMKVIGYYILSFLSLPCLVPFTGSRSSTNYGVGVRLVSAQNNNYNNVECYSSTTEILLAQLQIPPVLDFVLCPNTIFQIGTPSPDLTAFVGGEVPLMALHDNITIVCGGGGGDSDVDIDVDTSNTTTTTTSQNMCIISGGTIQFLTQAMTGLVPNNDGIITTNNLKLRGITFDGAHNTSGLSTLWFNAPGDDILIEDCIFTNLQGDTILSNEGIGEDFSSTISIVDSTFTNIVWKRGVIHNMGQTISLMNVRMENITMLEEEVSKIEAQGQSVNRAPIHIIDGITEITDSTFTNIDVWTSVVFVLNEVDDKENMIAFEGNVASNITIIDADIRDPSTYCWDGLYMQWLNNQENNNGNFQVECIQLFDVPLSSTETIVSTFDTTVKNEASLTSTIITESCAICGFTGTLINPDDMVSIPGPSGDPITLSCGEFNDALKLLPPPYDTGNCLAGVQAAQSGGCQCEGVPTATPIVPTLSPTRIPTAQPVMSTPEPQVPETTENPTPPASEPVVSEAQQASAAVGIIPLENHLVVWLLVITTAITTTSWIGFL